MVLLKYEACVILPARSQTGSFSKSRLRALKASIDPIMAPGQLTPPQVPPTQQLGIEKDGQDKDQRPIRKRTQEGQEVAKVGNSASNAPTGSNNGAAENSAVDSLYDVATANNGDISQAHTL